MERIVITLDTSQHHEAYGVSDCVVSSNALDSIFSCIEERRYTVDSILCMRKDEKFNFTFAGLLLGLHTFSGGVSKISLSSFKHNQP